MNSSLCSILSEGSLGLGPGLLPTPLAGGRQLPTASWVLLVLGQCLASFTLLPEISFLSGKTVNLPESPVLQVTRTCVEHLLPLA